MVIWILLKFDGITLSRKRENKTAPHLPAPDPDGNVLVEYPGQNHNCDTGSRKDPGIPLLQNGNERGDKYD